MKFVFSTFAALLALGSQRAEADWREDALKSEANYLVNCSFTPYARNNAQVQCRDAAYGALNNVRLQNGPDWVRPGEGAMAMIGLMAATRQLKASGADVTIYNAVIDAFFNDWLIKGRTAWCSDPQDPQFGGFASLVVYNADGSLQSKPTIFNTGTTGALLCAMWKYVEFQRGAGRNAPATRWLQDAYPMALQAGRYLNKCHNTTYHLLSPSLSGGNLWINDTALSVAGLRCLSQWGADKGGAVTLDEQGTTPCQLADALTRGLEAMQDDGPEKGFFKFRNPADGARSYGGSIDQLCFVPYETGALDPAQPFAKSISDFWTQGAGGKRMTYQTSDAAQWTYYGTRWHLYDAPNPESDRLTPGAGLQLAKVEWKYGTAHHDNILLDRAAKRFEFARSPRFSNLWYGDARRSEAGASGGIVDWRYATATDNRGGDPALRAPDWQRFIDTSAYFIEVTLMVGWVIDTSYTPAVSREATR